MYYDGTYMECLALWDQCIEHETHVVYTCCTHVIVEKVFLKRVVWLTGSKIPAVTKE